MPRCQENLVERLFGEINSRVGDVLGHTAESCSDTALLVLLRRRKIHLKDAYLCKLFCHPVRPAIEACAQDDQFIKAFSRSSPDPGIDMHRSEREIEKGVAA